MSDPLIHVADDFWNIRGSFKIFGVVDIGTHASLVRRPNGRFVLLDAYTLSGDIEQQVRDLTDGGAAVEAILNLHPFHTIHVQRSHEQFPQARLYGTSRHIAKAPNLPWQSEHTDDPALHALFDEFTFSLPSGVDFISSDENVHFSSVLAIHNASGTLHVDDTLMNTNLPFVGGVRFHPTLNKALQPRAGAASEFREWAKSFADQCSTVDNLCAAHTRALLRADTQTETISARILSALARVEGVLQAHEKRHG